MSQKCRLFKKAVRETTPEAGRRNNIIYEYSMHWVKPESVVGEPGLNPRVWYLNPTQTQECGGRI